MTWLQCVSMYIKYEESSDLVPLYSLFWCWWLILFIRLSVHLQYYTCRDTSVYEMSNYWSFDDDLCENVSYIVSDDRYVLMTCHWPVDDETTFISTSISELWCWWCSHSAVMLKADWYDVLILCRPVRVLPHSLTVLCIQWLSVKYVAMCVMSVYSLCL
jgi:hypothetical protein